MLKKLNDLGSEQATYFVAKVVENNDPLKLQRIKVTVPNLLEGSVESLPWCMPITSSVLGGNTKTSVAVAIPPIDSHVVVVFQGGDVNYGLVIGSLVTKSTELGELATNYPKRRGWVDAAGNHFFVDTTEGSITFEVKHTSGTTIQIDNEGKLTITTAGDTTVNATGALSIASTGNMTLSTDGTLSVASSGNMTFNAPRYDFQ